MERRSYLFKLRTDSDEWQQLAEVVKRRTPHLSNFSKPYRDWLNYEVKRLCTDFVYPRLLREPSQSHPLIRQIEIRDMPVFDSTALQLLERFAQMKGKTVAQIVQRYIIDYNLSTNEYEIEKQKKARLGI